MKIYVESFEISFQLAKTCGGGLKVDFLEIFRKKSFLSREKSQKKIFDAIFRKTIQKNHETTIPND